MRHWANVLLLLLLLLLLFYVVIIVFVVAVVLGSSYKFEDTLIGPRIKIRL